jgi:hypothetical protein
VSTPAREAAASLPLGALPAALIGTAVLAALLAWISRGNLNPDGVAYLDLADRLRLGDGGGFVQGYWSPLYPFLLAALLAATGASGHDAAMLAHLLNGMIALAGIALVWRAARHHGSLWGMLALTAFLVVGARTLRIDAVTPDLLLLVAVTGLGLELLRPGRERGIALGLWAGLAFLAKTSTWPWLLVVAALVGWQAWHEPGGRRRWRTALLVALVPVLLWTTLVSVDAGRPTIGSAARLNACWYLYQCDGRSPDTHLGDHRAYRTWQLAHDVVARVAVLDDPRWTYRPWDDPAAWQADVVAQQKVPPSVGGYLGYAGRQAGLVFGLWMGLSLVLVIIPVLVGTRGAPDLRGGIRREPAAIAMLLGLAGIGQFVAVHAEPRLIAPFVMLLALGVLSWRLRGEPRRHLVRIAAIGPVVAIGIGLWHLRDQSRVTASSTLRTSQLEQQHPPIDAPHRVAVFGPVFPMLPDLFRARANVVVQVMAPAPDAIERWPAPAQRALLERLQQLGVELIWISRSRDAYSIVRPPPAQ